MAKSDKFFWGIDSDNAYFYGLDYFNRCWVRTCN